MRHVILLAGIIAVAVEALAIGVLVPRAKAEVATLGDCISQARAMQFGRSDIQRRKFMKNCMTNKGFLEQIY